MILKFTTLILLFFSSNYLFAQSLDIVNADGSAMTDPGCMHCPVPEVTVSSSNRTISVSGTYTTGGKTVSRINFFHQYGEFGSLTSTNFSTLPTSDYTATTFSYSSFMDDSIKEGIGARVNFIQVVVIFTDNSRASDYFFINVDAALPVVLTQFAGKATKSTNEIIWQTAQELNNSHFEVERSLNGNVFKSIGQVKGHGTTDITTDYNFVDPNPFGTTYYRLRQVDFDGAFEYSTVILVDRKSNADWLPVYPTPVTDVATVQYPSELATSVTVEVYNQLGQIAGSQTYQVNKGKNLLNFDFSAFSKGAYFIKVQAVDQPENYTLTRQIIVQAR